MIYPTPRPEPSDPNIPDDIRRDLDEAKLCNANSCFRGSAVLTRRVLQLACIKAGVQSDRLVDQIKELTSKGLITRDIEEWANVVRWVGNDAAHPNENAVTKEDADDCLRLAEQFLHVLFVTPALAKARRLARGK